MNRISRRSFLATTAMTIAASRLRSQSKAETAVTLEIPAEATGPQIPPDFTGLSYEIRQFAAPEFFSKMNTGLIRAFRTIAPKGVLRIGGNTGEFAWWKATPDSPEPQHPKTREVEGEPKADYYPVTPEAVRNLADFLDATGWSCIYGINMGTNTPERAAEEAAYAAKILGPRIEYFQIGNEADLFGSHLRDPKTWNAKMYLDEWLPLARAIVASVPQARFGIPDVAANMSWLTMVADVWKTVENPPQIAAISHHYYFGGPATNPNVNIPNLLKRATMDRVQKMADTANAAAAKMKTRIRMTEGNTCYRGGKPGVSDVFASALWSADYSLQLASNGYSGINLHGGTGLTIASGLGGKLPGDDLLKAQGISIEQIAAHPHPFYTPIASAGDQSVLEPVAYGLIFAGALNEGTLINADLTAKLQAAGVNATAYAARHANGKRAVIVLNKDADRDIALRLEFADGKSAPVQIDALTAPALDSRDVKITSQPAPEKLKHGKLTVSVPRASGIRVTIA